MKDLLQRGLASSIGRCLVTDGWNRVVVLCYHSIHPAKSFSVAPEMFDRHLAWLKEHCDVIPFAEVLGCAGRRRRRPSVAITFDDGYADNYEYAFPLLVKYGLPATFFLTAGLLEKDQGVTALFQQIRESGFEEIRPMEWSQVREMRSAGLEFGAHTYSHPNLAQLSRAAAYRELSISRQILQQRLGEPITLVAYPFGLPWRSFTAETLEAAAEAGYQHAAAVQYRSVRNSDHRLRLPRFSITSDSVRVLSQKVYGWWDYLGWWQENAPARAAKIVSAGLAAASR